MFEEMQTADDYTVKSWDELLAAQLPGYKTSVQRAEFVERLAKSDDEYTKKYVKEAKAEIDKVPVKKRKDFRAKGELLDPKKR